MNNTVYPAVLALSFLSEINWFEVSLEPATDVGDFSRSRARVALLLSRSPVSPHRVPSILPSHAARSTLPLRVI